MAERDFEELLGLFKGREDILALDERFDRL